jgi:hypothetical protein
MNTTKAAICVAALLGSTFLATDADAHRRHHRSHVGIWFGVPAPLFYYPRYHYYPRYYYPPAVVVPAPAYYPPSTYIEQSAPPSAGGSANYWYYCRDSQAYYPYVQQCASPWQPVVPNSAPPS